MVALWHWRKDVQLSRQWTYLQLSPPCVSCSSYSRKMGKRAPSYSAIGKRTGSGYCALGITPVQAVGGTREKSDGGGSARVHYHLHDLYSSSKKHHGITLHGPDDTNNSKIMILPVHTRLTAQAPYSGGGTSVPYTDCRGGRVAMRSARRCMILSTVALGSGFDSAGDETCVVVGETTAAACAAEPCARE